LNHFRRGFASCPSPARPWIVVLASWSLSSLAIWHSDSDLHCEQFRIDSKIMAVNNCHRMRLRNKKTSRAFGKIFVRAKNLLLRGAYRVGIQCRAGA
jgi:hypothetical protein